MVFICNKSEIYEAIINVSKAVSERAAIACLEGIKLCLNTNILKLTGYDLELGIETEISVRSADRGEVVLNARFFADIIKRMPGEDIMVEIFDNLQVKISCGVTEYSIAAMSAEEYPDLPSAENCESFTILQPVLKSMINQTIFAVAQTDMKPILRGELFDISEGVFNLVALDGYRLAVRTEPIKTDKDFKFVVPAKALLEVSKLLKDEDELSCTVRIARKHIIFDFSGYMVYTRMLEGEFHPYKSAIPKECATEVIADTRVLLDSLDRAMPLINERTNSPVKFLFDKGDISISCSSSLGNVSDKISADMTGPMIRIGFKCRYMIDPLKACGQDKVKLLLSGSQMPLKIVPASGDESYTYLVLPVRL
ncbi:MAG: DNA polymerase III subunit beta [Oscillospiraceae bacterium]|nr:DNA polymerase III subunit beta [Oscillospiraceae bacterium]